MNSGYFFFIDSTNLSQGKNVFFYKPVREEMKGKSFYPIYVLLNTDRLTFHYLDYRTAEHTEILNLDFFSYSKSGSELSYQLKQLVQTPLHVLSQTFNPLKVTVDPPQGFSEVYQVRDYKLGHVKKGKICLATLLLDFLFDFEQCEVFKFSDKYYKIKTVIEDHLTLSAISAKANFLYYQNLIKSKQSNIDDYYVERVTEKWLSVVLDEKSAEVLSTSRWFTENMEKEMDKLCELIGERVKPKEDPFRGKIINFYLSRFNHLEAFRITRKLRIDIDAYILVSVALFISSLFFLVSINAGIIALSLTLFSWQTLLNPYIAKLTLGNLVALFMPRLTLTLFTSWLGYLGALNKLPQFSWPFFVAYLVIAIGLVFLYLTREIRLSVPDIDSPQIIQRSFYIIFFTLIISGIMGAFILTGFFHESSYFGVVEVVNIGKNRLALKTWASATITTFFVSLFVNLLFRGKKFTGF